MKPLKHSYYFQELVLSQAYHLAKELIGKKVTIENRNDIRTVTNCYLKADGTIWFVLDNGVFLYNKEQLNVLFEIEVNND